jgi:acyl-CoA synthetase (NDP forming)
MSQLSPSVERITAAARQQKRSALLEPEAKMICRAYNLPVPEFDVATDRRQALRMARKVGYPVVLKIVSQDILHKTEAGGVLVNLSSDTEVERGYDQIISNARTYKKEPRIDGVLVQHMAPKGLEVVVGGLRDKQFGAVVMFGLGGVFTEVLKDVTFCITPVAAWEAQEMIHGIKGYAALAGFRGQAAADQEAIASVICIVSNIMNENPMIGQLDLNPVMIYDQGSSVVDARIILE